MRALPLFAALPAEWPERREAPVPSAVGELFPHADVALNDDDARFVLSGDVAGAFETTVVVEGVTLRRVAWMARCEASGWRCMPSAALDGWCAWGGVAVPGEGLLVRLEASQEPTASPVPGGGASRGLTIVLSAASAPRALDMDALLAGAETERP